MFIDTVPLDQATGDVAQYYHRQQAAWGFLPNYAACFSSRPDVAQAWDSLNAAVRNGMDRHRFELVTITAARELRSTYCTVAHSKFLRDVCGDGAALDALAEDPSGAALADSDRAVYEFATKVARDASNVTPEDVRRLREVGLSDGGLSGGDLADVVFAFAARAFFTKVLDGLGAQPDVPTAKHFDPDLLASMVVGRPVADR